jgi:hypothetical protein
MLENYPNILHHMLGTSLNPVPNAQVCVYLMVHITKLQLQTTFFQNLSIYHIPHVFIGTLATKSLDVCTACDPWDSNIQLTMVKDWRWQIYPNVVQCLVGAPRPPPGARYAFPRQLHMHRGRGLFISGRVFFPIWCHPWMDDGTDGWCSDRILFSIPVPSQVDFFCLAFLSLNLSFFCNFIFSRPPSQFCFSPPSQVFFFGNFIFSPAPTQLLLFFFFWNFSHPPHCPPLTYVLIYSN